jgi:hypothetical protein
VINRKSSHKDKTSALCCSEPTFDTDLVPTRRLEDARERKGMSAMKLSPRWRKLLLTIHVVSAVSVLGTDLVLLVLGISSMRGADPQTVYPAAHLVATWLLAPARATRRPSPRHRCAARPTDAVGFAEVLVGDDQAVAHAYPDRRHPLRARAQTGYDCQRRNRAESQLVYRCRAPATGGRPGGGGSRC